MGREHPPIVFISGHASEKEESWASRTGAVAFLHKPFSDDSLLDAVRASISRTRAASPSAFEYSFMGAGEK
jgi:FixJ family two-component response regulator